MEKKKFQTRTVFIVIAFVVFIILILDLNNRLGELFRLSSLEQTAQVEVNILEQTKQALQTQIAYATSDLAVEDWAYEEGRMAREGDQLVIPLPPVDYTPEPFFQATPTPQKVESWQIWWALIFGE
jgi:hypothetical protein